VRFVSVFFFLIRVCLCLCERERERLIDVGPWCFDWATVFLFALGMEESLFSNGARVLQGQTRLSLSFINFS
jgi:hypothetical protein